MDKMSIDDLILKKPFYFLFRITPKKPSIPPCRGKDSKISPSILRP
jgi:hypothetical protein